MNTEVYNSHKPTQSAYPLFSRINANYLFNLSKINIDDLLASLKPTTKPTKNITDTKAFQIDSANKQSSEGLSLSKIAEEDPYKKALRLIEEEDNARESIDFFPKRYTKEDEGQRIHADLLKNGVLNDEFGQIYFGWFKSKNAFAFLRLHGTNGLSWSGISYKDYAKKIFKDQFVFANGHVFWK